jgi:transposase-like protein
MKGIKYKVLTKLDNQQKSSHNSIFVNMSKRFFILFKKFPCDHFKHYQKTKLTRNAVPIKSRL